MFFVLIVSLYTSRVVLNTLGVEDYGIYNVVAGFVSLFAFLNATLSASVQRFYNYEGSQKGLICFRSVYVTSFVRHLILAVIIFIILETFGLWYINNVMVLPEDRVGVANIVFHASVLSLLLLLFQIPYIGAIMAKQSMDFYAIVSVIDTILKLALAFALPYMQYDKLFIYAILSLSITVLDFILYYAFCKAKFQEISFEFSVNKTLFKQILGFTGWNVLGTFAFMLKGQGLNMLLNLFFGPVINAARGIAYQVNTAISGFSQNITIAFRPQIVNNYADKEYIKVRSLMYTESKICFMLIATLITPIILDIDYIMHLWLGNNIPKMTYSFTILVLLDSLVCTLNTPCTQTIQATGKIRSYQIASTTINLLLLPICWFFLKLGSNPTTVFILTIIISTINQVVCIVEVNKVFNVDLKAYIKEVLYPCAIYMIALPILPYLIINILEPSLLRLFILGFLTLSLALPLCYMLGLTSPQRSMVRDYLISKKIRNA